LRTIHCKKLLNLYKKWPVKIVVLKKNAIFAGCMMRVLHILLSVLLSVTILFMGSGITITRCSHTGTVRVMTAVIDSGMGDMDGMGCSMSSPCMSVTHMKLSPTDAAQTVTFDFQALQPVLAVLPCLVAEWLQPTPAKATVRPVFAVWKSPPRAYLNLIRILLI
jgi:hypothetical protein